MLASMFGRIMFAPDAKVLSAPQRNGAIMNASDVMVSRVITVKPDDTVQDVAALLLVNQISAAPVLDGSGDLVGIISEGDLLRRCEGDSDHGRPWWLKLLVGRMSLAAEFVKQHGTKVADIMTREVVCAEPDTPVVDIANMLESHRIKRVPIVRDGKIVGIVSRANLIQALAVCRNRSLESHPTSDAELRTTLISRLKAEPWVRPSLINVTVTDGTVDLWGIVDSPVEKQALRIAIEDTPRVKGVNDHVLVRSASSMAVPLF
jgi:CBS domain-containing protein